MNYGNVISDKINYFFFSFFKNIKLFEYDIRRLRYLPRILHKTCPGGWLRALSLTFFGRPAGAAAGRKVNEKRNLA